MISTLRELAAVLASEGVTVDGLVADLGGEPVDMIGNVVVDGPLLEGVSRASVVRGLSGDAPAHVTLDLVSALPTETLDAAFGAPTPVDPEFRGGPDRLAYELDGGSLSHTVALLASVEEAGATRVTLLREVRLGSGA